MGYLTTVTIYNDGAHSIDPAKSENERNIKQLATAIYEATLGIPKRTGCYSYPVGGFTNMIEVQDTRHADDHTVYVHRDNGVFEMNANSARTRELFKRNPEFAKSLLTTLKDQIDALQKLQDLQAKN